MNADGRTHLEVELKGGMLDGVRLQVKAEVKRVQCSFTGCSPKLASRLKRTQKRLAQALVKRGLTLQSLSAT